MKAFQKYCANDMYIWKEIDIIALSLKSDVLNSIRQA